MINIKKKYLSIIFLLPLIATGAKNEVVVYTSVDDIFARPIAEKFTKQTGIEIKLVSDTEETKSTGILNRLIAEKNRPKADVFWSGDPVRAEILKTKHISVQYSSPKAMDLPKSYSDPQGFWTGFSARSRVILYNTKLVRKDQVPKSILDLAYKTEFKGKVCIANPLFGTTSMHAAALFAVLGEKSARNFFENLTKNQVKMVSSNGEVRRRVAEGDCAVGVADSDDAFEAIKDKKPIEVVYPDETGMGTLIIPNATVLIAGGPNAQGGKLFIDYLLSRETELALAESDAAQIPLHSDVKVPVHVRTLEKFRPMKVDYEKLGSKLDELSRGYLKEWAAKSSL